MFVFVEAKCAVLSLLDAHLVEIMSTLKHLNVLLIKLESMVALVTLVHLACCTLKSEVVQNVRVCHCVFLDQVCSVEKDVLKISLSFDFFFKGWLKLTVGHVLLPFLLQKVDDSLQGDILCHPHHEFLDSSKQENLEVSQILLLCRIGVLVYDFSLDDIYLFD